MVRCGVMCGQKVMSGYAKEIHIKLKNKIDKINFEQVPLAFIYDRNSDESIHIELSAELSQTCLPHIEYLQFRLNRVMKI